MSSFNVVFSKLLILSVILGGGTLSACTLTPVYGEHGVARETMQLNLAAPDSRLEQIVYQELARRFGVSETPDAPHVKVSVVSSSRALALSQTSDPAKAYLETISGTVTITRPGRPDIILTRSASSHYTEDSQVLANSSAKANADEQAASALAQSLRLAIIAALTGPEIGPQVGK